MARHQNIRLVIEVVGLMPGCSEITFTHNAYIESELFYSFFCDKINMYLYSP